MLKKLLIAISIIGLFFTTVNASENKMFQTVNPKDATLVKTDSSKEFCNVCGMHLTKFYKTSHVSTFKNGHKEQYCSLHCQAKIHNHHKEKIKSIEVVDTNSLKLINAKNAYYVVGSSKKGTMSPVSKYAFLNKNEAKTFQKEFGGEIHTFDEALEIAKNSMKKDNTSTNKKRAMMAKKGKKIYSYRLLHIWF